MDEQPPRLDEEGLPILDNPVDPQQLANLSAPAGPDLTNHDLVEQLLETDAIRDLVNDLTEDLQKLVSWKIEAVLKEEVAKLIHSATEQSGGKLREDIRTQLKLALPELVANLAQTKPGNPAS